MQPINFLCRTENIQYLFCDIDDTLTLDGKLPASSYDALWDLFNRKIRIIPVTGRPAGWCEMMARFWPIEAVIGENGAFYFRYHNRKMLKKYLTSERQRVLNKTRLDQIQKQILVAVPRAQVSSDQFCRLSDLAIDYREDIPNLDHDEIRQIVDIFKNHGAVVKVSSIHINGWFGDYDKLTTCKTLVQDIYKVPLDSIVNNCAFIGDSLNDEPLFKYFTNSVGVANIQKQLTQFKDLPKFITSQPGAHGFVEFCRQLLA